ncbi:MAG: N-formylglutamate amidohydrolase [Thermodesulfobacteriota bacterium]|nr:N-formylglutamate amidohydrolase [Thermodesulfobacteriota bacterium]
MTHLSEAAIIDKIKQRELFAATINGGALSLKIDRYEPTISTAIHNGGNMRQELVDNCLLSQAERYYEEDPYTGSFIDQQPITLIGHDSRYEYDLNRPTADCIYETAWGKEIWKTPLSAEAIATGKGKHAQVYRIVAAIVDALLEDFGQCIVYDIHSYNFRRHERTDLPVFNLGTSTVKDESWRPVIETWLTALKNIAVKGVDITAAENDIFYGKGFLAGFCHSNYDNVLVLATEVKKVFMDELTGEAEEQVLSDLQQIFNACVTTNTATYMQGLKK